MDLRLKERSQIVTLSLARLLVTLLLCLALLQCGSNKNFESEHYVSDYNICAPDSTTAKDDSIDYSKESFQLLSTGSKIAQKIVPSKNQELWGVRIRAKSAFNLVLGARLKLVESDALKLPSESKVFGTDHKIIYPSDLNETSSWIEWKFQNPAN